MWSHVVIELSPGMGSPSEHRELMRANFHFGEERTVDQVLEAIKARHASPSSPGAKRGNAAPPPMSGELRPDTVAALRDLISSARDLQGREE